MPRHLPCLAFLLLVLCRAASSAHHPCERVAKAKAAELPLAAFASACSHAGTLQAHGALHSLHDARVYACVPLVLDKLRNGERSFASVPLSDDPLQHLFGSESFLGRAERADSTEQYAIDFLSAAGEAALLHGFVCYPGLLTGLQPGTYRWWVVHEFAEWGWTLPWNLSGTDRERGAAVYGKLLPASSADPGTHPLAGDQPIVVEGAAAAELPWCTTSMGGRWSGHAAATATFEGRQLRISTAGQFVPSRCRLRRPSWPEFDACMDALGGDVSVFGDSNSRRALKVLSSRGAWCNGTGEREAPHCMCEDCGNICDPAVEHVPYAFMNEVESEGARFGAGRGRGIRFVNQCGARSLNERFVSELVAKNVRVVVIAGVGAWDEAEFDLTQFQAHLVWMAGVLAKLPPSLRFIFRTAPFFCCTNAISGREKPRRYSEKRGAVMAHLYRRALSAAFPDALWWDTRALSEAVPRAPGPQLPLACSSNHLDSWLVAEDVAVLQSLLCTLAEQPAHVDPPAGTPGRGRG